MKIYKLGCNWGTRKPNFYNLIKEKNIVIGDSNKKYSINDLILVTNGFEAQAIVKITSYPISVISKPELEKDFKNHQIDYEDRVEIYQGHWYELNKNEKFRYETRQGIVQIHIKEIKEKTLNLYKKLFNEEQMEKYKKLLATKPQLILYGPPGTGKTRIAKQIANYIVSGKTGEEEKGKIKITDNERIKLIQFHPSYNYEDFVRGIVAETKNEKIIYKHQDKILLNIANKAEKEKNKKYILIIDEINRANLSAVLGELIYALEYRGEKTDCMYPDNKNNTKISIPENLYIIGTMNTADRSVGTIDYAIRRRFAFVQVLPDESVLDNYKDGKKLFNDVKKIFVNKENEDKKIYKRNCLSPEFEYNDVMIGHSYFMANGKELQIKLKYEIKPILIEYIKDGVLINNGDEKVMNKVENLSI